MMNFDLGFTRQPKKEKKMRERGEGGVGGGGKNWAHINEFTAGAAQSSSGG